MQSLSDEMLKLKSATKNYEETKGSLENMCESIDRISVTHQKLTDNMSQFLAEIKKMNYREQTDKILEQSESQSKALGDLVTQQTDKILKNNESQLGEIRDLLKKQADGMLEHYESQSKALRLVKYLVALGVLIEAAAIIGIFLR